MRGAYVFFGLLAFACNVSSIPVPVVTEVFTDTEAELNLTFTGVGYGEQTFNGYGWTATVRTFEATRPGLLGIHTRLMRYGPSENVGFAETELGPDIEQGINVMGYEGPERFSHFIVESLVTPLDPAEWQWTFRFHGNYWGTPIPDEQVPETLPVGPALCCSLMVLIGVSRLQLLRPR